MKVKNFAISESRVFLKAILGICFGMGLVAGGVYFLHPFVDEDVNAADSTITVAYEAADWTVVAPTSDGITNGITMNLTPTSSGAYVSAADTVSGAGTNVPDYTIYVSTSSDSSSRMSTTEGTKLNATSGTSTSKAALSSNSWGYAVSASDPGYSASSWAKVPYVASGTSGADAIFTHTSSSTGDSVKVYYGALANNSQTAGSYSATVTYSLVATY